MMTFQDSFIDQQNGLVKQVHTTVLAQFLRRTPEDEDFSKLTQRDELTPVGFMYQLFYDKMFLGWVTCQHTFDKENRQMSFSVDFTPLYSKQPTRQAWPRD
jgi:hypothetical protein